MYYVLDQTSMNVTLKIGISPLRKLFHKNLNCFTYLTYSMYFSDHKKARYYDNCHCNFYFVLTVLLLSEFIHYQYRKSNIENQNFSTKVHFLSKIWIVLLTLHILCTFQIIITQIFIIVVHIISIFSSHYSNITFDTYRCGKCDYKNLNFSSEDMSLSKIFLVLLTSYISHTFQTIESQIL